MSEPVSTPSDKPRGEEAPQGRADGFAGELRDAILSGRYAPGDRLPAERELAARHSLNRASVREALKKLEQQGLVEIRRGGGARVCQLHEASVDLIGDLLYREGELDASLALQILDVTGIVIAGAARLALERASEAELLEARRLLRRLDVDDEAIEPRLAAFDGLLELITRASDNIVLRMIYNALRPTIQGEIGQWLCQAMIGLRDRMRAGVREIDAAIVDRDPNAMEAALHRMQRAERQHLFQFLSVVEAAKADGAHADTTDEAPLPRKKDHPA